MNLANKMLPVYRALSALVVVNRKPVRSLCHDCLTNPPEYQAVRSYGLFNGVLREALHRLKYKGDMGIGESLSKHLIELYNDLTWDIQIVVPVPLSPRRTRERGYNQSGLLGRPFAYGIQKTYSPFALARTKRNPNAGRAIGEGTPA